MPGFSTTSSPTILITAPVKDATVNTVTPFISWIYASPGARAQASYKLDILNSSGIQIYGGAVINTTANSTIVPTSQLVSGNKYVLRITVVDSGGFTNFDTVEIFVLTTPPVPVSGLGLVTSSSTALVTLSWNAAASIESGNTFVRYEITRRSSWDNITKTIASISNRTTVTWTDYFCPAGGVTTYGVKVIRLVGSIEAASSTSTAVTTLRFKGIWLTDIMDPTSRVQLFDNTAKSMSWTLDEEMIRYWNSAAPTVHKGEGQYRTLTVSGMLFGPDGKAEDHTNRWKMFETLVRRKNIVNYRDGRGRYMFANLMYSETDSLPENWTINATLTEVMPPTGIA